jgi:hypothetical protein
MSKLGYANINEAFILGSQQIKDTQEEIAKLKALISETSLTPPVSPPVPPQPVPPQMDQVYQRIGPPPVTEAVFGEDNGSFNQTLSDLIKHPRFDDIVQEYLKTKVNNNLSYTKSTFGQMNDNENKNVIIFLITGIVIYLLITYLIEKV